MNLVSNEESYGNLSMSRRRAQRSVPRPRSRPNKDHGGWRFDLGLASEAPIRGNWYGGTRKEYTQESQVHLSLSGELGSIETHWPNRGGVDPVGGLHLPYFRFNQSERIKDRQSLAQGLLWGKLASLGNER